MDNQFVTNSEMQGHIEEELQLAKLNAIIFNFQFATPEVKTLAEAINNLEHSFSKTTPDKMLPVINSARKQAKMPEVSENDITRELNRKRSEVRQMITDKVSGLAEKDYILLATRLAESLENSDETGGVIDDFIDRYEIQMHEQLQKRAERILSSIATIRTLSNEEQINQLVDELIRDVKSWDTVAQPIQLKGRSTGLTHDISQQLGKEMQQLSVYLHNEKSATTAAAKIAEEMQVVFAELPELAESFSEASGVLSRMRDEQQLFGALSKDLDALKERTEKLSRVWTGLPQEVSTIREKIRTLNKQIKALDTDSETKEKLRTFVCLISREAAIKLHNERHETAQAALMLGELEVQFWDLPDIGSRVSGEAKQLADMAGLTGRVGKGPTVEVVGDIPRTSGNYAGIYTNSKSNNKNSNTSRSGSRSTGWFFYVLLGLFALFSTANGWW